MDLSGLMEEIDRLAALDDEALADPESLLTLAAARSRLDALTARATGEFDRSCGWVAEGARSATMWVTVKTHLPKSEARRLVRLGAARRRLPVATAAWEAGEISAAHLSALLAVQRESTRERLAEHESMLVGYAKELRFDSFLACLARWEALADPVGEEDKARDRRHRRSFDFDQSFQGAFFARGQFDPISGAIIAGELERLEQLEFEADWAEARQRLGRDPLAHELSRLPGQRRADALVEMASRSAAMPKDARRPAPLFTVLVDFSTFVGRTCELARGMAVSPADIAPWLDRAYIERAVMGLDRRVEVSHRARLFTGATRRAVELRDRECTHPICDVPAHRCQVDHVVPWIENGPTTQSNGQLLCGFHNREKEKRRKPPPGDQSGRND